MARAAHQPTDVTRGQVNALAQFGTPETEIALFMKIDPKTLRKHYRHELTTAHIAANLKVAQSLFKAATASKPSQGTVTAGIWWTKTRMGWREQKDPPPGQGAVGAPGAPGSPTAAQAIDLTTASTDDLETIKSALERISGGPRESLRRINRELCQRSQLHFISKYFEEKEGEPFVVSAHHRVVADTLDRVLSGEIKRLIINIPPGYTKTEMAVIHFVARGLALNPRARFIHASFNGPLALLNSHSIKDVIALPGYQRNWPVQVRDDINAKDLWRTVAGGGMKASSAAGPITGFRAGRIGRGFTGALIIDDPLKPDDADSDIERGKVNGRWHSTFKSRLGNESVPVIVIMQRLHVDDFSGYLLKGGAECKWHHLLLPVEVDNQASYPAEYTHGIPIPHGLPDGPLWPAKHTHHDIEMLRANPYVFAGQYAQIPTVAGGNMFKADWLKEYSELPPLKYRMIYADTAQKTAERNDYSVFQCWGLGVDGRAYLIDQLRGKWVAPQLEAMARAFWRTHHDMMPGQMGVLRAMKVEDKASGTDLIQRLGVPPNPIPVIPIPRDKDKVQRANDVLALFACGLVRIPAAAEKLPWMAEYVSEVLAFPGGAHDDQVDPTMDAVSDMLGPMQGAGFSLG